jgi:ribosomal RNA-processing protein 8
MFAVPGWSVSADTLKAEVAKEPSGATAKSAGKKRKREAREPEVTVDNVAEVWERVIERKEDVRGIKPESKALSKETKKARRNRREGQGQSHDGQQQDAARFNDAAAKMSSPEDLGSKRRKRDSKQSEPAVRGQDKMVVAASAGRDFRGEKTVSRRSEDSENETQADVRGQKRKKRKPPSESKSKVQGDATPSLRLTPLQASMRAKLISARFRHLNEMLYTRPSAEALQLFKEDPAMFEDYHAGFRNQVSVWPENPVTGYISEVLKRSAGRPGSHYHLDKATNAEQDAKATLLPLPRTRGSCTIADLGCGEGRLAAALQKHLHKNNLRIMSYDLASPNKLVTRADMANLPLADGSVDVAIFCLALMGTNWLDFVEEAYRVLRWKGELWVAEIKSRFAGASAGIAVGVGKAGGGKGPVAHSVGARPKSSKIAGSAPAQADDAEILATQVDGVDRHHTTDVAPFVDVLRSRGFVLAGNGTEAVDGSNKMFVKMTFVKGAPPKRGKMAAVSAEMRPGSTGQPKKAFIPATDPEAEMRRERGVLKPCVYKIR